MDAIKSFYRNISAKFPVCLYALSWFLILLCFFGCDKEGFNDGQGDQTASQISKSIIEHTNRLGELIPSGEELEKVSTEQIQQAYSIEYKIVDLRSDSSSEQIQKLLSDLGKDRWDCFLMAPVKDGTRLICKRRPISAVRTLLGIGGLVW